MTAPLTRTLSLSLPEELVGHVEVLHPTTAFDTPTPRLSASRAAGSRRSRRAIPPDSCLGPEDTITPACLQTLYGIPLTPATQTSNTLLVTGYTENWPQTAALEVCNSIALRKLILRAMFMHNSCSSKLSARICHPTRRGRWRASTGALTRRANSSLVMSSRRT